MRRIFAFFLLGLLFLNYPVSLIAETTRFQISRASIIDTLFPRKPVDVSKLGVNAFVNDSRFGSIQTQFSEVKNTLGIKYVRILFAWLDAIQPTPQSIPNFSFYDDIVNGLPDGVEAVVVLSGLPSWMKNSSNWIDGNPRKTFVEDWVKVVAARYSSNAKLRTIQVWNEPNMLANLDNTTLGVATSPENYVELLRLGRKAIKDVAPTKLVINAATTAINQNYPNSLAYNRKMKMSGAEGLVDAWAAHYYGTSTENIIRPGGVASFLNGIKKPLWFTESGAKGVTKQREYVERYWTFLRNKIKRISRIYYYQLTENTPAASTYGLKNLTPGQTTSDLYSYLSNQKISAGNSK